MKLWKVITIIKTNRRYCNLHCGTLLSCCQNHFVVLLLNPLDVLNRGDDTGITKIGMDKS